MKVAHLNVRSIMRHLPELTATIHKFNYDIIAVSETWLTPDIDTINLRIKNYSFFRKDRTTRGGGVGFFVRDCLCCGVMPAGDVIEQLWLSFRVRSASYVVGVVYRPPELGYGVFVDELESSVANFVVGADYVICLGDFNTDLLAGDSPASRYLSDTVESLGMIQLINEPTRIARDSATLLDLIIVTENLSILNSGVISVDIADHELIFCEFNAPSLLPVKTYTARNYKLFDGELFRLHLESSPFPYILRIQNVNDKVCFLNAIITNLFDVHAPFEVFRVKGASLPWLTDNVRLLMKLRDKAKAEFRVKPSPEKWSYYKSLRNYTKHAIENEKKAFLNTKFRSATTKTIWSTLKSLNITSSTKNNIPENLLNVDEINDFFLDSIPNAASVDIDLINYYNSHYKHDFRYHFRFALVDETTISKIIFSMTQVSFGPDGLSAKMIQLCCPYIVKYIVHIVNSCILEGEFPAVWKNTFVIPLAKRREPENYSDLRPISLISVLSKIFEKVLSSQLQDYALNSNIIPEYQSGFRPGFSCETALLNVTDSIIDGIDKGKLTALVLLDFSKAFDTVSHDILVSILHYIGLDGTAINLLKSYLSNRSQAVKVGDNVSRDARLRSGIPQGSSLSPLLFSIYTSSLFGKVYTCDLQLYADDTQLFYSFSPTLFHESLRLIQRDLDQINIACTKHNLVLNPHKSIAMLCGRAGPVSGWSERFQLRIGGRQIAVADCAKSLGLFLDNSFRFRKQININIQRAYSSLRMLYPHKCYLSVKTKIMLCNSLVLSRFSHCLTVYWPCIDMVARNRAQRIQNFCLRFIYGIPKYNRVSHKLQTCGWLNMNNRFIFRAVCLYRGIIVGRSPPYLFRRISFRTDVHNLNVRNKGLITPPVHGTAFFTRGFSFNIYKLHNAVPSHLGSGSGRTFRVRLFDHVFRKQCQSFGNSNGGTALL